MSEATVKVRESVEKKLEFHVEEKLTGNGNSFKTIDSEHYNIALFPIRSKHDPKKKARLLYNARVTLKGIGVTFQMSVKELTKDGSLIAGQKSRMQGQRCVVADWDGINSYERTSVDSNIYNEVIGIISASQSID